MTCSDQSNIQLAFLHIPKPAELFLFQYLQQFGLDLDVHIADFIKEYGSPLGDFQEAQLAGQGACKRARLVPEEFALEKLPSEPGAVQINEWLLGPRAVEPFVRSEEHTSE